MMRTGIFPVNILENTILLNDKNLAAQLQNGI